jgi:hypothetical protein
MAAAKTEVSGRELFRKYNILPLSIKYLISLLSLFCRQESKISKSFNIHSIHTRHGFGPNVQYSDFSKYQKSSSLSCNQVQ